MTKSRFSEMQLVGIIREVLVRPVATFAKKHCIFEHTIYRRGTGHGELEATNAERAQKRTELMSKSTALLSVSFAGVCSPADLH